MSDQSDSDDNQMQQEISNPEIAEISSFGHIYRYSGQYHMGVTKLEEFDARLMNLRDQAYCEHIGGERTFFGGGGFFREVFCMGKTSDLFESKLGSVIFLDADVLGDPILAVGSHQAGREHYLRDVSYRNHVVPLIENELEKPIMERRIISIPYDISFRIPGQTLVDLLPDSLKRELFVSSDSDYHGEELAIRLRKRLDLSQKLAVIDASKKVLCDNDFVLKQNPRIQFYAGLFKDMAILHSLFAYNDLSVSFDHAGYVNKRKLPYLRPLWFNGSSMIKGHQMDLDGNYSVFGYKPK